MKRIIALWAVVALSAYLSGCAVPFYLLNKALGRETSVKVDATSVPAVITEPAPEPEYTPAPTLMPERDLTQDEQDTLAQLFFEHLHVVEDACDVVYEDADEERNLAGRLACQWLNSAVINDAVAAEQPDHTLAGTMQVYVADGGVLAEWIIKNAVDCNLRYEEFFDGYSKLALSLADTYEQGGGAPDLFIRYHFTTLDDGELDGVYASDAPDTPLSPVELLQRYTARLLPAAERVIAERPDMEELLKQLKAQAEAVIKNHTDAEIMTQAEGDSAYRLDLTGFADDAAVDATLKYYNDAFKKPLQKAAIDAVYLGGDKYRITISMSGDAFDGDNGKWMELWDKSYEEAKSRDTTPGMRKQMFADTVKLLAGADKEDMSFDVDVECMLSEDGASLTLPRDIILQGLLERFSGTYIKRPVDAYNDWCRELGSSMVDYEAAAMPKSGTRSTDYKGVSSKRASLKLKNDTNDNLLIRYYAASRGLDGEPVAEQFVRAKSSATVQLPVGDAITVTYAAGAVWYGDEYRFGTHTEYTKSSESYTLQSGYTYTLTRGVSSGNTGEDSIGGGGF